MTDRDALIQSLPRMGIGHVFPRKLVAYIRQLEKSQRSPEEEAEFDKDNLECVRKLERYIKEGPFDIPDPYVKIRFAAPEACQYLCALAGSGTNRWKFVRAALLDEIGWKNSWRKKITCFYWGDQGNFLAQAQRLVRSQTEADFNYNQSLSFEYIGCHLGDLLAAGWLDWAVRHAQGMLRMLDIDGFHDADDYSHRRTQHFLLRLVSNWQGWPERGTPACAYDEPLFNALIEHWRTDDLELLQHLLLVACDRHTHQSRVDSYSRGVQLFDITDANYWYYPFEILSVLRLRQTLGLPNPELDHVIMNTPLGKLMEPTEPYTDELIEGVVARACLEFPELCEGTNIQPAAPVSPSSPPLPDKPAAQSWLGKLLGKS